MKIVTGIIVLFIDLYINITSQDTYYFSLFCNSNIVFCDSISALNSSSGGKHNLYLLETIAHYLLILNNVQYLHLSLTLFPQIWNINGVPFIPFGNAKKRERKRQHERDTERSGQSKTDIITRTNKTGKTHK